MFSGIVEEIGRIADVAERGGGRRIRVTASRVLDGLAPGDSIVLDGVCQTVVSIETDGFVVYAIGTTLARTTLGGYGPGRQVNLERALALGDRVGGHLVQGHADGTGSVVSIQRRGEHVLLDFTMPEIVADVTILHGSIAVNGVSLTVNALPSDAVAQVALVPFTWEHTALRTLASGDAVNLEGDLLGKFVMHQLRRSAHLAGSTAFGHAPGAGGPT